MRHKDGVDAAASAGLMSDLGLLPTIHVLLRLELVLADDLPVARGILLRHDFTRRKIVLHARPLHLARLLGEVGLGHHHHVVTAAGKIVPAFPARRR